MKNLLIIILLVVVIWLAWGKLKGPPTSTQPETAPVGAVPAGSAGTAPETPAVQPTPVPPTPEQEINKVLAMNPIPAGDLVALFDKYPQKAPSMFQGKVVKVAGKIQRIKVFGMENDLAEITLAGTSNKFVLFKYQLGGADSTAAGSAKMREKWTLTSGRLFRGPKNGAGATMFCEEGGDGTNSGTLLRVLPTGPQFQMVEKG